MKKKVLTDAVEILDAMYGKDPEWKMLIAEETIKVEVAMEVYRLREDRGLTQAQFARLVGLKKRDIDDLEESDHPADALLLLRRIAEKLDSHVQMRVVKNRRTRPRATRQPGIGAQGERNSACP